MSAKIAHGHGKKHTKKGLQNYMKDMLKTNLLIPNRKGQKSHKAESRPANNLKTKIKEFSRTYKVV